MRISDWSSDVCSSDLGNPILRRPHLSRQGPRGTYLDLRRHRRSQDRGGMGRRGRLYHQDAARRLSAALDRTLAALADPQRRRAVELLRERPRSEEHTSELQSLMRISYAVFRLKKKKTTHNQ